MLCNVEKQIATVSFNFLRFNNRSVVNRFRMTNSVFIMLCRTEKHVLLNSKSRFPEETFQAAKVSKRLISPLL